MFSFVICHFFATISRRLLYYVSRAFNLEYAKPFWVIRLTHIDVWSYTGLSRKAYLVMRYAVASFILANYSVSLGILNAICLPCIQNLEG